MITDILTAEQRETVKQIRAITNPDAGEVEVLLNIFAEVEATQQRVCHFALWLGDIEHLIEHNEFDDATIQIRSLLSDLDPDFLEGDAWDARVRIEASRLTTRITVLQLLNAKDTK